MRDEVQSAADFLTNMLRLKDHTNSNRNIYHQKLLKFHGALKDLLLVHYRDHWFPNKPNWGSGYRCLRINHKMDPIIKKAGIECGFPEEILRKIFPDELTLWVDPKEVCYRIGENGSICVLYDGSNRPSTELIEDISSSMDNLSLSESEDSGIGSPMSMSPPSPGVFNTMTSCKSEFCFNINYMGENHNGSYIEYVAS